MTEPLTMDPPQSATDFDVLNPPGELVSDLPGKMLWYARLAKARREADERVDQIKARMAELDPHLIEEMALHGIEKQTIEGMTIYPTTDFYVSKKADKDGVTQEVLCEALRLSGWGYLVGESYSASSLKAKIKELRSEGKEVPAELVPLLNIGEMTKLATRKA